MPEYYNLAYDQKGRRMDGHELADGSFVSYMEVLSFNEQTGRGVANFNGALVVFEGKLREVAQADA